MSVTPTPSITSSNTPTITPSVTNCPGICFSGTGTNALVSAISQDVFDPTKFAMVGQFTTLNGITKRKMVRAYTDGEVDTTFDTGTSSFGSTLQYPTEFIQQPDGKYVVVGSFSTYSGVSRNRIARLNYDGTLDTSFVIGTGFSQTTYYAALDTGNKILVCSLGTQTFSGSNVGMLCRLNTDGSLDTTFQNNIITGTTSQLANKVIRNSDGTYFVSGLFLISGRRNLIKLNSDGSYASTDPFNTSGAGFLGTVNDFEVLSDGKLIVVGDFTQYNGASTGRGMIRLNADGTKDATFATPGYSNYQYEVLVQGSKYISVGFAYTYSGQAINNITRINNNGTLDTTWNSANFTSLTTEDLIQHLYQITGATSDAGNIFCAGFFNSYDGVLTDNIVKMDSDGYILDCDPILVTPTNTSTPGVSPSNTPSNTATQTQTPSQTATPTSTPPDVTPSQTATNTPSQTATEECLCFSSMTVDVTVAGNITFKDCNLIDRIFDVTPGLQVISDTDYCIQKDTNGGTAEYTITSYNDCCSVTPPPSASPTATATMTQTPSQTATPELSPSMTPTNTPTPSITPSETPPNNCVCYLFQNEDSTSSSIFYTPCGSSSTSEVLPAGQAVRRCIDPVAENPSYTGGVTTIVPCSSQTTCDEDSDCTNCS
jgi:uncharacterized delta-60 repeat protein